MNIQQLIMAEEGSKNLIEQINLVNIGIIMLNVLILFGGLTYLLYKPVRKFIASRAGEIDKIVQENKTFQEEIKQAKITLKSETEKAKMEAGKLNQEALDFAEEKKVEILADAGKKREEILAQARLEAENEKNKMEGKIKDMISEVSVEVCESILKQKVTEEIDRTLIDEAIKEYIEKK